MTKLEQNIVLSKHLGWQPRDFGAGSNDYTAGLITSITATQEILGVKPDGVAGPLTYTALIEARQHELLAGLLPGALADAGQIALYELKLAWMRDGGIIDLPSATSGAYHRCQKFIDSIIRTQQGINWDWEAPYAANTSGAGNFEWCGAAAAYAWRAARMKLTNRRMFFASTYRLDRWARYMSLDGTTHNVKPASGPYRQIVELDELSTSQGLLEKMIPRAGDILLLGPSRSAYGKHVALVESFDHRSGIFTTFEGNGTGQGPDGMRRHGVVMGKRLLGLQGCPPTTYHARRLIRVAYSDLIG